MRGLDESELADITGGYCYGYWLGTFDQEYGICFGRSS